MATDGERREKVRPSWLLPYPARHYRVVGVTRFVSGARIEILICFEIKGRTIMISVVSMKVRCLHANRDVHIQFNFDWRGSDVYIFNEKNCENEPGQGNAICQKCYERIFERNNQIRKISQLQDMRAEGLCYWRP